jgi:RimJ/RimL family protein N-acetyltransferase
MHDPVKALAAELPDLPRWLEVRSMLLSGDGRVIGAIATSPLSFVVLDSSGTAGIVGRPSATAIRTAAEQAREILAVPEDAGWAAAALPEWNREEATLFVRDEEAWLPAFTERDARLISAEELVAAQGVPATLREELLGEAAEGDLVAGFAEGRPVAFCYPSSVTERWWDVSIDTLEDYRRQGHAARAVACAVRHMAETGREPAWGAVESNVASASLALKLGFRATDRLDVFSRGS